MFCFYTVSLLYFMSNMKYRRFGRTELQMPVFSCGGMRYQQAWKDLAPDEIEKAGQENLEATIHRALELGINHIETARGYGSSEMQLGWILPRLPREKMIVQTKVGPNEDPKKFLETFEQSMDYLQVGLRRFAVVSWRQQRRGFGSSDLARWLHGSRASFTKRRARATHRFFDARLRSDDYARQRDGRIRLSEPALLFCQRAELAFD